MKLKLEGLICTRIQAIDLAEQHADVTEIDFSAAQIAGGSTMHQLLLSFPAAKFTGLEGHNEELFEMAMEFARLMEERRNDTGY